MALRLSGDGDLEILDTTLTNVTASNLSASVVSASGTVTLPSTTSIGAVSSTELGFVDGVTSALQTQLNAKAPSTGIAQSAITNLTTDLAAKAPTASPTFTGEVKVTTAPLVNVGNSTSTMRGSGREVTLFAGYNGTGQGGVLLGAGLNGNAPEIAASRTPAGNALSLFIVTDAVERARVHSDGGMSIGTGTKNGVLTVAAADARDFVAGQLVTGINFVSSKLIYDGVSVAAANVTIEFDAGNNFYPVRRSTSSIKYKTNVETLEDEYADKVLELRPVWYRSLASLDKPEWSHYGLIAEEVADVDPRLVHFEKKENGTLEPEGVQYDRLIPHLINIVQRQQAQIDALIARIELLEAGNEPEIINN